jgi:hypothetical protein
VSGVRGGVMGSLANTARDATSTPSGYPHRAGQLNSTGARGTLLTKGSKRPTVPALTVAALPTGLRRLIWTRAVYQDGELIA